MSRGLRALAAIGISLGLLFSADRTQAAKTTDSIRGLSWSDLDHDTGQTHRLIHCTAFAVGKTEVDTLYLTAAHCVTNGDGQGVARDYWIGQVPAHIVGYDVSVDLALMGAPGTLPLLPIASRAPKEGDEVTLIGYPYGWGVAVWAKGIVSTADVFLGERHFMLLNLTVGHGHSGAPILNKRGEVVSVMQQTFCRLEMFCPESVGAALADVHRFIGWSPDLSR